MALPLELLNRLLTGKELLLTGASRLTPNSDPLLVARAILASHDASELITSAVSEYVQAERKNKVMGLMDYIAGIESATDSRFPGRQFFENLNRARVSFKHHGLLPNSQEFHQVLLRTEEHMNQVSLKYLGVSIGELDLSSLIADAGARSLYTEARDYFRQRLYKEALEKIAQALRDAVAATRLALTIVPGESDSQTALELTAYGVDPGAFLRMQEFLPKESFLEAGWQWNTRDKGHPGNWRDDTVSFCLTTFVDIVRKIQFATYQPSAINFSFLFDDVLTARHDGVLVHSQGRFGGFYGESSQVQFLSELKCGQTVRGRLTPGIQFPDSYKWQETLFELANVYIVANPIVEGNILVPDHHALIVRSEDVDWTYEPRAGAVKEYSHLFKHTEWDPGLEADEAPRKS